MIIKYINKYKFDQNDDDNIKLNLKLNPNP